jgi:hypothetical protein
MWNRVKWAMVIALIPFALGQAGCNLGDAARPPLAGPSELGQAIGMTANPDQLTANGSSSSVVEVTLRDEFGQPEAGVTINFDLAAKFGIGFSDIGVLAPLNSNRPVPGGQQPKAESAVTNTAGKARVRYWSPFRTDQENDIVATITSRPAGGDFNSAVFRTVDIFLRAANRPNFPGGSTCSILVEPNQVTYDVGELIFFTATQIAGPSGFPIARYEWNFSDGTVGEAERNVAKAFEVAGTYAAELVTTESQSGTQSFCTVTVVIVAP